MAWPRAKLVTEMSARVPVRVPRSHESRTSQLSSTTSEAVRVGDRADGVPVGAVAHRLGARIALVRGPIIAAMLVDVDLVGVGVDVDEHRDDARLHHRRDVGRERERRA